MYAYRKELQLDKDGSLVLADLPFKAGDKVEVIVLNCEGLAAPPDPYSLYGTPIEYEGPTDPVANDS